MRLRICVVGVVAGLMAGVVSSLAAAEMAPEYERDVAPLLKKYCAGCHDWQGDKVGQVVPIAEIGTDPHRLDSFTEDLAVNQNTLGAGQWD